MSGHSKWSTIKRAKGAADIKRGMAFTKVANAITIATRSGNSGDPNTNPRLRVVIDEARSVNMPKENIQRAIDRGLGRLPGQTIEEVTYEGFGPGKVAFFLEGLTDNKMRTLQEVKNLFEKNGGSLGTSGATAYMFEKVGEIKIKGKGGLKDDEELELIDLGAEDVEEFLGDNIQKYLVYTESSKMAEVSSKITQANFTVESANLVMKPKILQEITDAETVKKVLEFTERLEENDDIQKVYANFDITDNLITL